ncbi:hypothetical protein NGA_0002802, partial [Nannochloropsis gaditana CCMP526]|uniref:uncharacterized protein n=1 Tax=Nannochloropsis gaditana (strain CCMP526) TaxID=1093141 RepID=UPI00029F7A9B
MDKERVPQEQNGHIRNLQEVFEYAVERGRLDPHVAQGHAFDNGNLVLPVYQSLGPSQVAVMGGAFDLLANPEGYAGVGPGA